MCRSAEKSGKIAETGRQHERCHPVLVYQVGGMSITVAMKRCELGS